MDLMHILARIVMFFGIIVAFAIILDTNNKIYDEEDNEEEPKNS